MTYRLTEKKELPDLQGTGYVYEHIRTKAKVCFIKTDDENKTFSISFRTPPTDDTGLPHILEHSVLCGSRKYPIKDPFIELSKGSLNTFLNAITYSDKTMYPVASVNDQDFHNLIDVYLDAVFYPNIHDNPMIFKQEGWHYELNSMEDTVTYKGVVYNEMKGVFSSPEQTLFRRIQQEMFENHPYSHESGGDPMAIPKLSHDQFKEFHRTYYHPSNSYIFYYGDVDMEQELDYLNEQYLCDFDYLEIDSHIPLVDRFESERTCEFAYPVAEGEGDGSKCYLSYNVLLCESSEVMKGVGFDILEYLMVDAPGAPIKEALLKAGIGEDVFCSFDSSIRQGTFSIIAKNCNKSDHDRFKAIVEDEIRKIQENGFDDKKVRAAINKFEFRAKEADFGQYPKGVIYAIKALETWLHDASPFVNFMYDEIFDGSKKACSEGLLQQLLKDYFIDNTHKVHLILVPDENFNEKKQSVIDEELRKYEESLDESAREGLIRENQELTVYQEAADSKENLEKLPMLKLSDIPEDKKEFVYKTELVKDAKLLLHTANATNIAYIKCSFDVGFIEEGQLPLLSLLSRFLIKTSTEVYSYSELNDEINERTGGLSSSLAVYEHKSSSKYFMPRLELTGKCFIPNLRDLFDLMYDILNHTDFSDISRLRDLINENKSRTQMRLISGGHSTALLRAESYFSRSASFKEKVKGIEFYDELTEWQQKSDEDLKELAILLKRMLKDIVSSDRLTLGVTVSEQYLDVIKTPIDTFIHTLPYDEAYLDKVDITLNEPKNEGFKTTGDVQYVAMSGDLNPMDSNTWDR